jgi:hypothetical protein
MPKQILTKKENPVVMKNLQMPIESPSENNNIIKTSSKKIFSSANITNVNNVTNVTNLKSEPSPDKLIHRPSSSKKNISSEEKSANYDDRIQPFEIQRSKSKKSINTPTLANKNNILSPDNWICDFCNTINKPYEFKCHGKNLK